MLTAARQREYAFVKEQGIIGTKADLVFRGSYEEALEAVQKVLCSPEDCGFASYGMMSLESTAFKALIGELQRQHDHDGDTES